MIEEPVQGPQGWGKASIQLNYGPETLAQRQQIIQDLIQHGLAVRVFTPRPPQQNFQGGGFRSGYPSGGYNRYGAPPPQYGAVAPPQQWGR